MQLLRRYFRNGLGKIGRNSLIPHHRLGKAIRYDDEISLEGTMQALSEIVRQDKVCILGVSNWPADRTARRRRPWKIYIESAAIFAAVAHPEVDVFPDCGRKASAC
jgi:aryl-alcohol dehydrogenase-like predicted oxidoreductase